jgi:hypothetical protein
VLFEGDSVDGRQGIVKLTTIHLEIGYKVGNFSYKQA